MTNRPEPLGPLDKAPPPKELPPRSFLVKLIEVVIAFAIVLLAGSVVAFSLRIGRPPWSWTGPDWQAYLTFSKERVDDAKDRVQQIDWGAVKTKITDDTRALWDQAPALLDKLKARIGGKSDASPAPEAAEDAELTAGLAAMRAGVEHYRASVDDPEKLHRAKVCFEEAQGHLEKAVVQVRDEQKKAQVEEDLKTCNKYLEDCRSREK